MSVRGLIVVGVSRSTASRSAVRWAAAEAERRGVTLSIVHAYPLPQLGQPVQHDVDDLLRNEASTLLDRVADCTRGDHPQLEIATRLVQGAPVNALRDASVDASLTVVGVRNSGRLAGAIMGSVASAIAGVNPGPVAVVHPDHPTNGAGPVVVGVDGKPGSSAAVEFAFEEAAVRHTELVAVHATNEAIADGSHSSVHDPAATRRQETPLINALAQWREKNSDVVVTHAVRQGRPATVLLEYCRSASMVVVGRRSRGEVEALVLGSTSRALTTHSPCPVVIARSHDSDASRTVDKPDMNSNRDQTSSGAS